jgi:Ni,Fe-hydrogenase I small subunit
MAAGNCATYGGIHAMQGKPDGLRGAGRPPWMAVEIGWQWKSSAGLPIVIPLDEALRPTWLFGDTVHSSCFIQTSKRKGVGMKGLAIFKALAVGLAVAGLIVMLPDIKRYIKISTM